MVCVGCIAELQQAAQNQTQTQTQNQTQTSSPGGLQPGQTPGELVESIRPSPIFLVIVAAFIASCVWATQVQGLVGARWATRGVVFCGWIVSLCLHEFGHAATAYVGGDHTVAGKGYLTLDPRKYAHASLSLAMPIVFLLLGGIGLPGGAVWINQGLIRSAKMRSLMSLAGPGANFVCALAVGIPLRFGAFRGFPALRVALAFLALLQVTTMLLNLLPIPGLDGFGVLSPFLPRSVLATLEPIRQFAFIGLFVLISATRFGTIFWDAADTLAAWIGVPTQLAEFGRQLFRFDFMQRG
jgi:Zn-dependent protease